MSKLTLAWVADHADTVIGELGNFGDLRDGFFALGLGRRRHPEHGDVLAQRRHGLGILRHFEIAANDREIGLALAKRLGAGRSAIGLHRTQADQAMRVRKGLGQRLNDLDVIAVLRTHRDPQAHRPHRKVVSACERTDHGEYPGEGDEHHLLLRRTRRRRDRRPDKVGVSGHRSREHSLQVQIHAAYMVTPITYQISCQRGVTSASWLPASRIRSLPTVASNHCWLRFERTPEDYDSRCGFGSAVLAMISPHGRPELRNRHASRLVPALPPNCGGDPGRAVRC